jgi:hypothetical protein
MHVNCASKVNVYRPSSSVFVQIHLSFALDWMHVDVASRESFHKSSSSAFLVISCSGLNACKIWIVKRIFMSLALLHDSRHLSLASGNLAVVADDVPRDLGLVPLGQDIHLICPLMSDQVMVPEWASKDSSCIERVQAQESVSFLVVLWFFTFFFTFLRNHGIMPSTFVLPPAHPHPHLPFQLSYSHTVQRNTRSSYFRECVSTVFLAEK